MSHTPQSATVHYGPQGGLEYRLWTGADTFRIVSKYAAMPHMSAEERTKVAQMEAARKASQQREAADNQAWRELVRGG